MQSKMYFFVPVVRPCTYHKHGGISESHACKDCVWPIILDAELYTTCPGERVLVVITHQVQCNIPTFEALLRKRGMGRWSTVDTFLHFQPLLLYFKSKQAQNLSRK